MNRRAYRREAMLRVVCVSQVVRVAKKERLKKKKKNEKRNNTKWKRNPRCRSTQRDLLLCSAHALSEKYTIAERLPVRDITAVEGGVLGSLYIEGENNQSIPDELFYLDDRIYTKRPVDDSNDNPRSFD